MFETADIVNRLDKKSYAAQLPDLRVDLLKMQERLKDAPFPVMLLLTGDDNAGRADFVNLLHEYLDPRFVATHAFSSPTDEETERPTFFRYWRALPPRGQIGLFFGSWYGATLLDRLHDKMDDGAWQQRINRINRFENTLTSDGVVLIKVWIHLGKDNLKKRIRSLEKDPDLRWKVTGYDRAALADYDKGRQISERMVVATSSSTAPWMIVNGECERARNISIMRSLVDTVNARLDIWDDTGQIPAPHATPAVVDHAVESRNLLQGMNLAASLEKKDYREQLAKEQARLAKLARKANDKGISTVMVFEGMDAAGKGGTIRRLLHVMDARHFRVIPIAAPSQEERRYPYLWRFWRHIPRRGRTTIFDRSWYGRLLVERVEAFARIDEWQRAYAEINEFEHELSDHDFVVIKFWLQIDKDEQLARFKARESIPWKQHKITDEDYRNREKWVDYEKAANEMIHRTSTDYAPWNLVSSNCKRHARVTVVKTVADALEKALEIRKNGKKPEKKRKKT